VIALRQTPLALLGVLALSGGGELSGASLRFSELPLPAAANSAFPDLASAQDGNVYVSWVEKTPADSATMRIARFDRATDVWGEPVTIATGADWFLNWADTPVIATGLRGRVAAAWSVHAPGGAYYAMVSTSDDHGATWTVPARLTTESNVVEFVELAPLLNGTWLAVWLDGRDKAPSGNMQLRSRVLGSDEPDMLVDDRVCDCCPLATLVLPNGVVVTAYRDRTAEEIRDIAFRRYSRGTWTKAPPPVSDGWVIDGCPVNGPSLSRRSGNVNAAWFTGANNTPQVLAARSNNLTRSWNLVIRVDDPENPPRGAVASAVLRDGSHWIGWWELSGDYALRAIHGDGSLGPINRLTDRIADGTTPRMLLLDNRSNQPARFLIASTHDDRVRTTLASLPADPNAPIDDCGCTPEEAATRGHAFAGVIVSRLPDRGALMIDHEEIPGVMPATTGEFQVDRRVVGLVEPGQRISARVERRADGNWWLFSIRIVGHSTS